MLRTRLLPIRVAAAALTLGLGFGAARAQTPPAITAPQIDPGLINNENRRNQLQLEQQSQPQIQGPAVVVPKINPNAIAPPGGPKILLRRIEFDASHFLTRGELDAIAARFVGTRADISDIQRLVKAVNDLYAARGIATAAAYLPPQDLKSGTLRVGIVEGKLGKVDVKGNAALSADFLRGRVSIPPGEVVDVKQLASDVARQNKTGVAQIQAFLQPGAQFGLSDIQLAVLEPPINSVQLFIDNQGVASVGKLEGGMLFQRYAPLGIDDKLTVYMVGSGGNTTGNAAYSVPFDASGGRLGGSFSRGHIHVIAGPFTPLDIDGFSTNAAFNASQPVFVDPNWLLLGLASFGFSKSTSSQTTIPITNNDTYKGTGGFTLGYVKDDFTGSITPTYTHAHADFNLTDGKSDFDLYDGTFGATYRLPEDFLATLGGAFQVASTDLIPGDSLFQIGGATTVRGYPTDAVAGPTGYYGNLEFHHGLGELGNSLQGGNWLQSVDAYAFYDRGGIYATSPKALTLNAAGIGFSDAITKYVQLDVNAGFPLNKAIDRQSDYQLFFRLTAKLE